MIMNENFKVFFEKFGSKSHIWGEMFEILKKPLDFEKNSMILKKTQCYGVLKTQWDSLKLFKTSKTTFNNDQPRSGEKKDLWLETL